jgi:IclR family acetate operon transcriptional repressor
VLGDGRGWSAQPSLPLRRAKLNLERPFTVQNMPAIKVLDKAVRIIELLAASKNGVRLKDVAARSAVNKATASRILRALEEHHLAVKKEDATFVLGNRVLWWETCRRRNLELLPLVRPHLETMRDLTTETTTFSIVLGDKTVFLAQALGLHVTSARFQLGDSAPLHAGASGKVALAFLATPAQNEILKRGSLQRMTKSTITDERKLRRELRRCVGQGFATSQGERYANTSSVAAPVFNRGNRVLGVVSVIGPSERLNRARLKEIGPALIKQTQRLSEEIRRAGL